MASRIVPGASGATPHVCAHCPKAFERLCDLNKHAKSHSRPYKCSIAGCKYTTLGWPTAKELERHNNDKHSASPRTFPCRFPPCPYSSKRESNCKQHMEKAHNWVYVRSKSKGKRSPAQNKLDSFDASPNDCGMTVEADHSSSIASTSPPPLLAPPSNMDFVLFDDDQADAMGEDDDDLYPAYGDAQGPESYLPWTSPMTRLKKNESFIEMFTQAYNGTVDKTMIGNGASGIQVDPILSDETLHDIHNHQSGDEHEVFASDVVVKVESPAVTVDQFFPRKRKQELIETTPMDPNPRTGLTPGQQPSNSRKAGAAQAISSSSKAQVPWRRTGGSGDGNERPSKRSKPTPSEDFTDTSMPDIFRYAHPQIYDRDQHERYSPCHTLHRDISTLVRHLSRPAHRLKVTERSISSFDIFDTALNHPKVGLCRCCWETFDDRQTFEVHISLPCQKVSKGKREKWRALLHCFTPLVIPGADSSGNMEREGYENLSTQLSALPIYEGDQEIGTPPTSVPSPVIDAAAFGTSDRSDRRFVSTEEHHKLQREHQALREKHQQLELVAQVLVARQLIQGTTMPTSTEAKPCLRLQTPSPTTNRLITSETTDRDNLVQHMDSQKTDVNVQGLMDEMESAHQCLSRMNSGLSTTSRSTIHHVPPSPPPRPIELVHRALEPARYESQHRPPLPSIPDSGYGTEQRRGSLADVPKGDDRGAGDQQHGRGLKPLIIPPSSLETQEKDTPPRNFPWGTDDNNPSGDRTPRATSPSQANNSEYEQNSGHEFLTAQEMAEYDDASYNNILFGYPDNSLMRSIRQSSPTLLDFAGFEFPSSQ